MAIEYLSSEKRREQILDHALILAEKIGYKNVRRHHIGESIGCSGSLVPKYCGSVDRMRDDVVRLAAKRSSMTVLVQALADKNPALMDMIEKDADLKAKIIEAM